MDFLDIGPHFPNQHRGTRAIWNRQSTASVGRRLHIEVLEPRHLLTTVAEPRYSLTELEPFPGGLDFSVAASINDASQVVGHGFYDRAALWNNPSHPQDLGVLPGYDDSFARAISQEGLVLGLSNRRSPVLENEPWLWTPTSGMRTLQGEPFHLRIQMNDLNATQIVGHQRFSTVSLEAVIWDEAGGLRPIALPFTQNSSAEAINAAGQVVGFAQTSPTTQAFIWDQASAPAYLGDLPGGEENAAAFDISDTGYVVGYSGVPGGLHAFRWHVSTGMVDLGDLPGGRVYANGMAVNNSGQVVGVSVNEADLRAIYWDPVTGLRDLNTLINAEGYVLTEAVDINDLGQIVANGLNPEGARRGFLLTLENRPPVLNSIGDQVGAEGMPIAFTANASDPDEDELTFSLDAAAPAGAGIDPVTGMFSWTPSEAQGPGTFDVTVRVTDNGDPALDDSETITITVAEVNQPPVLAEIDDRSTEVGQAVQFTVTASDPDLPPNDHAFSLDAAPSGAAIDPVTGEFSWTPTPAQSGQTLEITVRVTDDGDPALFDTETFSVTVLPLVEPQFMVSAINGPNVGVPGQLRSYFATFTDPDSVGGYTATIDWGDGTVDSGFVATSESGGNTTGVVSFWHAYTTIGDRTIELTLRDGQGDELTAETDITVQLVTFQPDPLDTSRTALVAGGLDNVDDMISFSPQGGGINVMYRDYNHGQFTFDGSVVAFGQGGNDTITVHPSITRSAMLFGQAGNDQLFGGGGSNVLIGGTGADMLFGSGGRDLLFGGLGADVLQGLGGDDLLVSDYTVHEYDQALLAMLFHRWTSSDGYADRLHNLRFEEHPALNNTTVFNDFEVDQLTGGQGQDWFLFLASDLAADPEHREEGLGMPF